MLPDNCFKLETPTLAFEDTDNHKKVKAFFYIDKIKELDKANYILPLVLNNSSDDINIDKRQIFIVPDIVTPYLYFEKSGYQPYKAEEEYSINIVRCLPFGYRMKKEATSAGVPLLSVRVRVSCRYSWGDRKSVV